MLKLKYIVEFDPLSYTGYGAYIVKENDDLKTPYCIVLVPFGDKKLTKQYAKVKAEKIAAALDFKDNISEMIKRIKIKK